MHQRTGQHSFADEVVMGKGRSSRLERIYELIDWEPVAGLVTPIYDSPTGRPSYPPLVMVKALMLAQWYNLSDPQLEEALADRLSFRRFVGLSLDEETPDHVTIWRFRRELTTHELAQALLSEVNRQLAAHGLLIKQGTLLDATLVKAQARRPAGGRPGQAARSEVDPDANWTRRDGGYHFGYKAHLAVDQHSSLVRGVELTPAKVNESEVADRLICGDERAVYADKAYENKHRRQRLKAAGIKDRIMHRSHKNQPALPHWQQKRNKLIAPIRKPVEHLFGTLKRSYGYTQVRYYSLAANTTQLFLLATALNLRRAEVLTR